MKSKKSRKSSVIKVMIDPELNQLDDKILFPEKLRKANDYLLKHGVPIITPDGKII